MSTCPTDRPKHPHSVGRIERDPDGNQVRRASKQDVEEMCRRFPNGIRLNPARRPGPARTPDPADVLDPRD